MLVIRIILVVCVFVGLNADLITLRDFEKDFCGSNTNTCSDYIPAQPPDYGVLAAPPVIPQPDCCGSCSCNISTCILEDSCCLDALEDLPTVQESLNTFTMTCDYPQLRPYRLGIINAESPVRMITQCKYNATYSIQNMCENADNYTEFYTKVPVADRTTNVTYRNKYCALCNGIAEDVLVFWTVRIDCDKEGFDGNDINTIVEDVYSTATCNLIYDVPPDSGLNVPRCTKILISTCNETGLWQTYDAEIEAACHAYTTIYRSDYKNVFCYMCNIHDLSGVNDWCPNLPQPFDFPSFSAYLVLPSNDLEETKLSTKCNEKELYDPISVRYLRLLMLLKQRFLRK